MGLVYAEGKYTTLTDILGAEDAFGDMDFKVAGTADAITALQLDTKIDGIPADVLAAALDQAKEARTEILANMNACIAEPRAEVAATAPKIISITIPMDKIGEVIGPKGKVINTIQQETGADITVSDDDGMARLEGWRRSRCRDSTQVSSHPPCGHVSSYSSRLRSVISTAITAICPIVRIHGEWTSPPYGCPRVAWSKTTWLARKSPWSGTLANPSRCVPPTTRKRSRSSTRNSAVAAPSRTRFKPTPL